MIPPLPINSDKKVEDAIFYVSAPTGSSFNLIFETLNIIKI